MARSKKNQDTTFRIANTTIRVGDVLEVIPKKDYDAPTGFQDYGTTKLLMEGIKEIHGIDFDEEAGMWNTGFSEHDVTLHKYNKDDRQSLSAVYFNQIKNPYEERYNQDVGNVNDEFWNEYNYEIYTGKRFDTSVPKDMFDLYHALMQGDLCEQGEKDSRLQRSAKYNVRSLEQSKSLEDEKTETKFKAGSILFTLVDAFNPKKDDSLYAILEWCNIPNMRGADKDVIKKAMIKSFDNDKLGFDNAQRFIDAYDMSQDEDRKGVIDTFSLLSKLFRKKVVEYKRKQYFLGETFIGNHLKEASYKAEETPELKEAIIEAYSKID